MALDMQVEIKDAILEGGSDDKVLESLILLTMTEISSKRPLFPSPMDEPVLYAHYFRKWVKEGMEGLKKANERKQDAVR